MNRRRRTLPPVPPKAPTELRPLIVAMSEILETGEGMRGDPLDRKITLRDLLDSGIGKLRPGMRPGQDGNLDSGALPPAPDLTIPPAPQGFDAQGSFYGMVNLSWTIPGQQYRSHAFTNVYRSETDNFANAEIIGQEAGAFYSDFVRDDAIDPDDPTKLKGYYYWISFTSVAGIEGPANSPNGTYAAPVADVGYVLELLTGKIDAGVLAESLKQEIDKIDRLDSLDTMIIDIISDVDFNFDEALAEETAARMEALAQEQKARADALLDMREATDAAIEREIALRIEGDERLASVLDVVAATQSAQSASFSALTEAFAESEEAWVARTSLLQAETEGNRSLILATEKTLSDNLESVTSRVNAMNSRVADNHAAITGEAEARAEADQAITRQAATAQSRADMAMAAIRNEESTRASEDEALARQVTNVRSDLGSDIAAALTLIEASVVGDSIIQNGMFSTGDFTGWPSKWSGISIYEKSAGSGTGAIRSMPSGHAIGWSDSGHDVNRDIYSSFHPVTAGDTYVGFLDYAGGGNGISNSLRFYFHWLDETGSTVKYDSVVITGRVTTWSRMEPFSAVAPEGAVKARILLRRNAGGNGSLYITNVRAYRMDEAMSQRVDALAVKTARDTSAAVQAEASARADADSALSRRVNTVESLASGNSSAIQSEASARSNADAALGRRIDTIQSSVDANQSTIRTEASTRASADTALGRRIDTVQAAAGDNTSSIQSESRARASADTALGRQITDVQATFGQNLAASQLSMEASIQGHSLVSNGLFATGDFTGWASVTSSVSIARKNPSSGSGALRGMPSEYAAQMPSGSSGQYIYAERRTVAAGQSYNVRFSYSSGGNGISGEIRLYARWYDEAGTRIGLEILISENLSTTAWRDSVTKEIKVPAGAITAEIYVYKPPANSPAYVTNVIAERADSAFSSSFVAKVQAGGLIGGFGLYNDSETVDAGFDVDGFWVGRTNSNKRKPFIITGNDTYLDAARIRQGSIQEGQLGPITVGKLFLRDGTPVTTVGGLIRAEAIDVDNLSVAEAATFTGIAKSNNYQSGRAGWMLNPTGAGEINFAVSFSNKSKDTDNVAGWAAGTVRDMANNGNLARGVTNGWTRPGSTQINGNQISTADAYVDTLVIRGEAVTAVASATANGGMVVRPYETAWRQAQTIWIPPNNTGSPVTILAVAFFEVAWSLYSDTLLQSLYARLWDATENTILGIAPIIDRSHLASDYRGAGPIVLTARISSNWHGKTVHLEVLATKHGGTSQSEANYVIRGRTLTATTTKR